MKKDNKWVNYACLVLTGLTVIVAALFIIQTLRIYLYGISPANQTAPGVYLESIYSPKVIAAHFAQIAPVVYLWLAWCVGCIIARCFFPAPKEKPVVEGIKQWREEELARQSAGKNRPAPRWIAPVGLAVAAALIVMGVFNGGMKDVFAKAVMICTECVGLG